MPFPKKGDIVYVARQSCCGQVIAIDRHDNAVSLDLKIRHELKGKDSWRDHWRVLSLKASEIKVLDTPQKVFSELLRLGRKSDIEIGQKMINDIRNTLCE